MEFKTVLRQLRLSKNLTQVELAEELSVSRQLISSYERGTRKPDIPSLILIADFFDVTIDHLVGRTSEKTSIDYLLTKYDVSTDSLLIFIQSSLDLLTKLKNK